MAYDRKKAEALVAKVLDKLDKSSIEYGSNYILNDISREVDEELIDIVGWPLMEVLRLQETMQKMIYKANDIYWEKFLKNQTDEFLQILEKKVVGELGRRYSDCLIS